MARKKKKQEKKIGTVRTTGGTRVYRGERMFRLGRYGSRKADHIPPEAMMILLKRVYNDVLSGTDSDFRVKDITIYDDTR